jgi:hypothetical protein
MTPEITFTTGGYDDAEEAEVYYAVVSNGQAPAFSKYTLLNPPVRPGEDHKKQISLTDVQVGEDCDIYVIIYKDGEMSEPEIINTAAGGEGIDWEWGLDTLYVKSDGLDTNSGDKAHPLATIQTALQKIAAAYASDHWPDEETPGTIIILDMVTEQIYIGGDGYPSIVLCDDPAMPGGIIKRSNGTLLEVQGGTVTLSGGLILQGDSSWNKIVDVGDDGIFIMDGGEISDNTSSPNGGGVYVGYGGMFVMKAGKISGNSVLYKGGISGGGVYVEGGGRFTMTGGEISNNSADESGGGVYVEGGGMFTMNGGEISNNSAVYGGGVYVAGGTFTMNNGKISDNSAFWYGGGVYVDAGYISFIMNGGVISGNSACYGGGGVHIFNPWGTTFAKLGGTIYGYDPADPENSNVVKDSSGVIQNDPPPGHAIFNALEGQFRTINTTVGPEDILRYNYPTTGEHFGWGD